MLTITKIYTFEACHHLPHYVGACHSLHGHSYKLEVTVTGAQEEDMNMSHCGMIMDFKELKKIIKEVAGKYDHADLNLYFRNPTAENMVEKIALDIMCCLPNGVSLVSCKLWETADSYAEYSPLKEVFAK